MRIADPTVISPVVETFAKIDGFARVQRSGSSRCASRIRPSPSAASTSSTPPRAASTGSSCTAAHELEIVLHEPYPQLLYWFTMPFTAPVPWEAVDYYDGRGGRPLFQEHPVGDGPIQDRALRAAQPHRARAQRELVRRAAPGVARARRDLSRATASRATPSAASCVPSTWAARCRSSTASSSASRRRASPRSTSSCRATTTRPGSSRRASTASSTRARCRPRCRRAACRWR